MRFEYEFGDVADENNDLVAKVEMHEHGTLLAAAQEAQEAFWDALYELEVELKLDIRSTDHLAGLTIEDLREKYK